MKKEKILYAITDADVKNVADEMNIKISAKNLPFIEEKIGDYFGDKWRDAIEFALNKLGNNKK